MRFNLGLNSPNVLHKRLPFPPDEKLGLLKTNLVSLIP